MIFQALFASAVASVTLALAITDEQGPQYSFSRERGFDPRVYDYAQRAVKCPAMNRAKNLSTEIDIHYIDVNPTGNKTLIMVHGWPAMWASWKHQIQEFQNDYRVIAMDVRGFGSSTHPGDVESSATLGDLTSDISCVLKNAGVIGDAICVGHDWGSQICYEAARMRPDIIHGVIGITVPYLSWAGPFTPIEAFTSKFPRLTYQVYFRDNLDRAAVELEKDIRRTLRSILRDADHPPPVDFLTSKKSFLDAYANFPELPPSPFLGKREEDYWVRQFNKSGFRNGLEFYQQGNRYGSWRLSHDQGNFTVPCPSLSILPTADPVAEWSEVSKLVHTPAFVPQLTEVTIRAAHWAQLERPVEVNKAMRDWLEHTFGSVKN